MPSKLAFRLQGHLEHQGLEIAVENRKGSVRKGVDKDGTPWRTVMKYPYGYIKGTKGSDGEEVDCYVGPDANAEKAYVVHQNKDDGKTYDEDKVMLGFGSLEEARAAYLKHYNDPKFLGPISAVPMDRFKKLMESGKTMKKISSLLDELVKIGTVSEEDAQKALDRYESLQKSAPTMKQVGRYAALGAVAGPAIAAVGNAVRGGRAPDVSLLGHLAGAKAPGLSGVLRGAAGSAVTGALGSGAVPLVRAHLDRQAEMGTLRKYMAQQTEPGTAGKLSEPFVPVEKSANAPPGILRRALRQLRHITAEVDDRVTQNLAADELRGHAEDVFQAEKQAAGAATRGGFLMSSEVPAFRAPRLDQTVQHQPQQIVEKLSAAVTPAGMLTAAKRVGTPRVTPPPGPSIAQVAKPKGFGKPIAGAVKNGI